MDKLDRDAIYEWLKKWWHTPPWESSENRESAIDCLIKILPNIIQWKHILDYWCWNGHIWEYFLQKWANIDFADISHKKVESLRIKYSSQKDLWKVLDDKNCWYVRVFQAETPNDLPVENQSYDYIIMWNVLHHIDPNYWKWFLDKFWDLLKTDWKLILQWVDETSILFEKYQFKWCVTWDPIYAINSLPEYLDSNVFEIEKTWLNEVKLPMFDYPGMFRYFVIKHK